MLPRSRSAILPPLLALVAALAMLGCDGPGRVQFDGGRCLKDGRSLTSTEVEAEQATVARRIASRQPWFAVITIGVVLIAAAGNAERALVLVRRRHSQGARPLLERLRDALVRQGERPALLRAIVGGSLAMIVIAGGAYVYLDIDKRASERALGMLQFCHLAMRTQAEEGVLDEQRKNLLAIESTAGDIRTLVGKLPPDEQRKAQLIVEQMNSALDKQGRIVGDYLARNDEAEKDLSSHTVAMEKGIASVEGELSGLRTLPADLKDLQGAAHKIGEQTSSFDAQLGDLRAHVVALDAKLDSLLARPPCPSPPPAAKTEGKAAAPAKAALSASPPAPSAPGSDGGNAAR